MRRNELKIIEIKCNYFRCILLNSKVDFKADPRIGLRLAPGDGASDAAKKADEPKSRGFHWKSIENH